MSVIYIVMKLGLIILLYYFFDNVGNTTITNFCINYDILSGPDVIECFEGELLPGESVTMEFGPITTDGGGGVTIKLETLEGEETDITWPQPIACYQDAVASCIYGCTDEEATNYDPTAEWDDGSCTYDLLGCTDPSANNYNPWLLSMMEAVLMMCLGALTLMHSITTRSPISMTVLVNMMYLGVLTRLLPIITHSLLWMTVRVLFT